MKYFTEGKRQTQSDIHKVTDAAIVEDKSILPDTTDVCCTVGSDGRVILRIDNNEIEHSLAMHDTQILCQERRGKNPGRRIHRQRRATRRWTRRQPKMQEGTPAKSRRCFICTSCEPLGGQTDRFEDHCGCVCERNEHLRSADVALVQLTDNDVEAGRTEETDGVTDDVLSTQEYPLFSQETKDFILRMQTDDFITEMISYVSGAAELPTKQAALILPARMKSFLRHFKLFHVTPQGVLLRQWTTPEGQVRWLLVVSDEELQNLIEKAHEFAPATLEPAAGGRRRKDVGQRETRAVHSGVNRTQSTIGRHYYHHALRSTISNYIKECAVCILVNHPRGKRDDQGLQTPTTPGISIAVDFCGPWNSETTYKYLFCAVDLASRYAFVYPTKSTKDTDAMESLLKIRAEWNGLPRRLHCDSAICQSRSISTRLMETLGVEITHSLPHTSTCQAKVERFIGTISRTILKLKTASPSTPFETLVGEARLSYNNTSTDLLGGRCPSDLHFFRSNANLVDVDGTMPLSGLTGDSKTAKQLVDAKKLAQDAVLRNDVRRFRQRRERENPGDANDKLKIGDLVMKKRTSFWGSIPRKLQWKVDEDAMKIVSKLATNSFKVTSIMSGQNFILPGGQLVKSTLTENGLKALVTRMKRLREGTEHVPERPSTRLNRGRVQAESNDAVWSIDAEENDDGPLFSIF